MEMSIPNAVSRYLEMKLYPGTKASRMLDGISASPAGPELLVVEHLVGLLIRYGH